MADIAAASRDAYKSLVYDSPDFVDYFRAATPIDVIERIGGRAASADVTPENEPAHVRVVPWMFAWTQNRCLLPYWFGAASGLAHGIERHGEQTLARDVRALALFPRARLRCRHGARESGPRDRRSSTRAWRGRCTICFFPAIGAEYRRCVEVVLTLSRQSELLEASRTLRRAIRLRNPYVDPMSFLQVDLLERWRRTDRQDDAVLQALMASVNGIAHGMQTIG